MWSVKSHIVFLKMYVLDWLFRCLMVFGAAYISLWETRRLLSARGNAIIVFVNDYWKRFEGLN